jgi:dTDP-4-amino-4,6-dideoxygalactose transaminase
MHTSRALNPQEIPFNNFQREPEQLIRAQLQATETVLRSGWWVLGKEVLTFEHTWAKKCGTASAVGVANGLDAIEIGLRALGIGPGDEVITTPLTAFATTLAIQRCGATPVFADINPGTACLDPASVERCISKLTRAVLVVHLYGRAADLSTLASLCFNNELHLVEDCAQAHGAQYRGKPLGSIGAFGAWSFYPTKNLGAIGDAGMITSDDPNVISLARQLRNYGQSDRYHHELAGLNSRLDELQAAILLQRLNYLVDWTNRRRAIANQYWAGINHPLLMPLMKPADPLEHVHHLFVLCAKDKSRQSIQDQLLKAGIKTLIHYPVLCHEQIAITNYRIDSEGLPSATKHKHECFSLPIHPYLSDDEVNQIIKACNSLNRS